MLQALVSTKYQIVIPKAVRKKTQVKPGQKLSVYTVADRIVLAPIGTPKLIWPRDHIEILSGMWKDEEEIKTYLKKERNSWE